MSAFPSPELSDWLQNRLGRAVRSHRSVGGGCIHQAWCLETVDGRRFFAKTNAVEALALFEAEAAGLEALARWAPPELLVPRPLAWGAVADRAVLVLPWLTLCAGGGQGPRWVALGQGLARLHRNSRPGNAGRGFGFQADNFIGSAPQPNAWHGCWARFFADCRLAPQFAMAAARGERYRGSEALLERLPDWLGDHPCDPVLVHGDLWSGNASLLTGGDAVGTVFDPACSWSDREVDLAMARLFGGFPASFFEGYAQEWPLPPGADRRCRLYNLYHLLNHANLFGGGYRLQAQQRIDEWLEE